MPPFSTSHQKRKWKCQNKNAKGEESGRIFIVGHVPLKRTPSYTFLPIKQWCVAMAYYKYTAWFFAFGIFVLTLPLTFLMRYTKRRHNLSNLIISQTLVQIESPRKIIQRGSKSHFLSNISILPTILLFKVLMVKDINKCYPGAKLRDFYPNRSRSIR